MPNEQYRIDHSISGRTELTVDHKKRTFNREEVGRRVNAIKKEEQNLREIERDLRIIGLTEEHFLHNTVYRTTYLSLERERTNLGRFLVELYEKSDISIRFED